MRNIVYSFLLLALMAVTGCDKSSNSAASANSSSNSANGSLTRFITVGNYLYMVDNSSLKTYSIAAPANPVFKASVNVGFAIETIFPYQDKLFIGSSSAMYIYSISNPENPAFVSQVAYFVRGRDPIVAIDSVAYSTVRNVNFPGGVLNVFNIKNISQPQNVRIHNLQNPYGLGLKDSALYVCEAEAGLRIFNIKNTYLPAERSLFTNNETYYDVIVQGNMLICYIKGGLSFVDITNLFNPVLIATVKN